MAIKKKYLFGFNVVLTISYGVMIILCCCVNLTKIDILNKSSLLNAEDLAILNIERAYQTGPIEPSKLFWQQFELLQNAQNSDKHVVFGYVEILNPFGFNFEAYKQNLLNKEKTILLTHSGELTKEDLQAIEKRVNRSVAEAKKEIFGDRMNIVLVLVFFIFWSVLLFNELVEIKVQRKLGDVKND